MSTAKKPIIPNSSARIYAEAFKYLGVREVVGRASNPIISEWIRQAARWLDPNDDATPWCGCFRGAIGLATGTGVPREHFRARSWMDWGRPVTIESAVQGDTVILSRPGGNHVGLFDRATKAHIYLLGGNQSNSVNIQAYRRALLLGVRRG